MKISARCPRDLAQARYRYYDRLGDHFVKEIGSKKIRTFLEAGCGGGELTLALLRKLPKSTKMIAVDSSKGPYTGWLEELVVKVRKKKLGGRVNVIRSDVRHLSGVDDQSVDGIVSNELICDLPRKGQLEKAVGEFYRVLKPGGVMVHGEWLSLPSSGPDGLLIKHWPSWTPDQLFLAVRNAGFLDFHVSYFDTTIHLGYANAIGELRTWGATGKLLRRYDRLLRKQGIELPFEHVIRCRKKLGFAERV